MDLDETRCFEIAGTFVPEGGPVADWLGRILVRACEDGIVTCAPRSRFGTGVVDLFPGTSPREDRALDRDLSTIVRYARTADALHPEWLEGVLRCGYARALGDARDFFHALERVRSDDRPADVAMLGTRDRPAAAV